MWAGGGCGKPSMLGIMNGSGEAECGEAPTAAAAAAILFACKESKETGEPSGTSGPVVMKDDCEHCLCTLPLRRVDDVHARAAPGGAEHG